AGVGAAVVGSVAAGAYWYRGTDGQVLEAGRQGAAPKPPTVDQPTANKDFLVADRPLTDQAAVARHVNYYEFSPIKVGTWRKAAVLPVRPWTLTVDGLVGKPKTFDVDELAKLFGDEQRVYRHRCVETWAMVVPWSGFPLRKILEYVEPKASASYVRFVTADVQALTGVAPPGGFPWPYEEGLTLPEAMNELSFLATGFYGEPIFKQNGAPVRLVLPWKYGFKSAKSLVKIELTDRRPDTFWNTAAPHEYGFYANVDPAVDHPRWSQKTEWMIDTREQFPTKPYNGYGEWVAKLYTGKEV
ncbi:MAG: protein-methionine-sulfoxide reductase catalytic subunit MsrP, partial [Planctomycetia bacterium]